MKVYKGIFTLSFCSMESQECICIITPTGAAVYIAWVAHGGYYETYNAGVGEVKHLRNEVELTDKATGIEDLTHLPVASGSLASVLGFSAMKSMNIEFK